MLKLTKNSVSKLLRLSRYDYVHLLKCDVNDSVQFTDTRDLSNSIVTIDWDVFIKFLKLVVGRYYIKRAKAKFGNRYTYFNFFLSPNDMIYYVCPVHGVIHQKYSIHYRSKVGCPKCARHSKVIVKDTKSFIEEANKIHNNKYCYSKVDYKDTYTKITIICPIHGEFSQMPTSHLSGSGCYKCSKITFEDFALKANQIYNNKYKYENCDNFKLISKVKITCPIHGNFWQEARSHLRGVGCLKCSSQRNDIQTFVEKAIKIHGDKYDYSLVNYINAHTPVEIICKKHGKFLQNPTNHLCGKGCPKCRSSKGELKLIDLLSTLFPTLEIIHHYKSDWLKKQHLDIYLPKYNIGIEYNGKQHYCSISNWGGEESLKNSQQRDAVKLQKCKDNNCILFIVSYDNFEKDWNKIKAYLSTLITGDLD